MIDANNLVIWANFDDINVKFYLFVAISSAQKHTKRMLLSIRLDLMHFCILFPLKILTRVNFAPS